MSSLFPMKLEVVSMGHEGGTKSYHTYTLVSNTGCALVIYRYGKVGTTGTVTTEQFALEKEAHAAVEKKLREKDKRGYRQIDGRSATCINANDLTHEVGTPIKMKITKRDWAFLAGEDFDAQQEKALAKTQQKQREHEERQAIAMRMLEEANAAEEEIRMQEYQKTIPNWGRF